MSCLNFHSNKEQFLYISYNKGKEEAGKKITIGRKNLLLVEIAVASD